jgi:O-antigen/teichoic acid export membrane protein
MPLANVSTIFKNTVWVSLYTGLFRLVTLGIAILSARLLNVEDYGKVSVLQSTSALFIMLATMGLGTVATKLVAQDGNKYVRLISQFNIGFCFAISLFVLLTRNLIASDIFQDSSLTQLVGMLSVYIFLCGVTQVQTGILAGKQAYSTIASINLSVGVLSVAVVYLSISQLGLKGWLVAVILIEGIKAGMFRHAISSRFKLATLSSSKVEIRYVLSLALPIAVSGLFILPVNWFLIRTLLLKEGYADVALMNIADQWIAILTFVPIALGDAMLPLMSKMKNAEHRKFASSKALKMNIALALIASIPIALLSNFVLSLYGEEYQGHSAVFWIIVPLVVVLSVTNQLNNRVIADNNARAMLMSNIIWMALCLPIALVLLNWGWGLIGLLTARLLAYLCKMGYLLYVSK